MILLEDFIPSNQYGANDRGRVLCRCTPSQVVAPRFKEKLIRFFPISHLSSSKQQKRISVDEEGIHLEQKNRQ